MSPYSLARHALALPASIPSNPRVRAFSLVPPAAAPSGPGDVSLVVERIEPLREGLGTLEMLAVPFAPHLRLAIETPP